MFDIKEISDEFTDNRVKAFQLIQNSFLLFLK